MQSFFQQLLSWAANNDMIVNFTKTKEMILGPPSKTVHLTPLSMENGYTEQVNSFKLLGFYIDNNFSCTSHIDAILSKATTRLYFLKQLKRAGVPPAQLRHFYLAVVRPILEYAFPVWHHLINKAQTDQTESIQRRAIRIMYDYTFGMPYTNTLYVANIPS